MAPAATSRNCRKAAIKMSRALRKFVLTAHITFAVSWIGAVVAFLVLAVAGLIGQDAQTVRAVYVSMDLVARFAIVPLSFAPLITGPALSLGTPWGLFQHYWTLLKLIITILSTLIMQLHMQPIAALAAAAFPPVGADLHRMQIQMVIAASAALLALLAATALGTYKPQGMTPYGWRKYEERAGVAGEEQETR